MMGSHAGVACARTGGDDHVLAMRRTAATVTDAAMLVQAMHAPALTGRQTGVEHGRGAADHWHSLGGMALHGLSRRAQRAAWRQGSMS
jgi:hypothetical protein